MKQKLKPETWVGIFLIAGILMILGVILGFGGLKTTKEQTYPINIIFKDSAGLIKDSQIRLAAFPWEKSPRLRNFCLPAMK